MDIKQAQAAVPEDKNRILNSIIYQYQSGGAGMVRRQISGKKSSQDLAMAPVPEHPAYEAVNRALASHFSLSSWFGFVTKGRNCQKLMDALSADHSRRMVQLSMSGCFNFKDADLRALLSCLPQKLCVLRLDLAFTGRARAIFWRYTAVEKCWL